MKKEFFSTTKRVFDLVSASTAMIVSTPIWLIVAAGIELSSKGPVFYRAERIGKSWKPFTLYKFRSMHVYIPQNDPDDNGEKGFIADEDRIFRLGCFLRKSKIDELPQLLNILANQMSVVGPRPMTKTGAKEFFTGKNACIMRVKPGLTCLDSLFDYAHGELYVKDNEEYQKNILPIRTELAKMYVEKQSVGLDAYCILRTIRLIYEIAIKGNREFEFTVYEAEAAQRVKKRQQEDGGNLSQEV